MEDRKKTEIEYYDRRAEDWLRDDSGKEEKTDFEGFDPNVLSSYAFCYEFLKDKCKGQRVLDYGCGNGIHSIYPAKHGAKMVIGIDLSEASLKIARERAEEEGVSEKIEYVLMDCEKTEFPDNFFDIIFDGGTFSSLDLKKAFPELARVLKPDGFLIGIETFGHNPFTNFKRKINELTGKRTKWAASHIFKNNDLRDAKEYFDQVDAGFFHLVSWLAFPFLSWPGGVPFLKLLEIMDKMLVRAPFLRKYSFKVVFVFSNPKKHD